MAISRFEIVPALHNQHLQDIDRRVIAEGEKTPPTLDSVFVPSKDCFDGISFTGPNALSKAQACIPYMWRGRVDCRELNSKSERWNAKVCWTHSPYKGI